MKAPVATYIPVGAVFETWSARTQYADPIALLVQAALLQTVNCAASCANRDERRWIAKSEYDLQGAVRDRIDGLRVLQDHRAGPVQVGVEIEVGRIEVTSHHLRSPYQHATSYEHVVAVRGRSAGRRDRR
jgi:hypothetical protein